ncbi:SCO6745 family protein [Actinomadura scrupuli]|uniref:SCO6745 family protein n=1 Tax=Actinomadura scrupuli TaxID=559629 RepID=UPI003D95B94F
MSRPPPTALECVHVITSALARRAWSRLEPVHGMIYFVPEAPAAYAEHGVEPAMGYFASRSAALGRVPAETVIACFYNFCPALVRQALPAAWDLTTPAALLTARLTAADQALRRGLGESVSTPAVTEAAGLARRAAEAASERPEGRPLFAAHAALPWPDEHPHLVLWHAQTLLREFRGDGHLAALLLEGLDGLEALILHGAGGEVPIGFLRATRGWPDEAWDAAVDRLRARGLLAAGEPALSEEGRLLRERVEERTDQASLPGYGALSEADAERLCELGGPISRALVDAGLLPLGRRRPRPAERRE